MEVLDSYMSILTDSVKEYMQCSEKLEINEVMEQARIMQRALQAEYQFLCVVQKFQQPNDKVITAVLKDIVDMMQKVKDQRNAVRGKPYFDLISCVSESVEFLGWITMTGEPAGYIKGCIEAAAYYSTKIVAKQQDKDSFICLWIRSWQKVLLRLREHATQYHRKGVKWNGQGQQPTLDAVMAEYTNAARSFSLHAEGGLPFPPPPPPPPPPTEVFMRNVGPHGDSMADARAALFQEINQGTDITKCLKSIKPSGRIVKKVEPLKEEKRAADKPTKQSGELAQFYLDGKKWRLENIRTGHMKLENDDVDKSQSVYVYKCSTCDIEVCGKVNCIVLDGCKKVRFLCDDILASLEIISCQDGKFQTKGCVPTITVDKCDNTMLYIDRTDYEMSIFTSKSSSTNILYYDKQTDDYVEYAVPEQLKVTFSTIEKKPSTCIVDIH